jgi:hypothetical protein
MHNDCNVTYSRAVNNIDRPNYPTDASEKETFMPTINIPSGVGLISTILCILIIVGAAYTLKTYKPKIKLVLGGTIGCAAIVLWHLVTTPPMYEIGFGQATELMALLICITSLLGGYYLEVARKGV